MKIMLFYSIHVLTKKANYLFNNPNPNRILLSLSRQSIELKSIILILDMVWFVFATQIALIKIYYLCTNQQYNHSEYAEGSRCRRVAKVHTPPLLISDDSNGLLGRRVSKVSTPPLLISWHTGIESINNLTYLMKVLLLFLKFHHF